MVRTFQLFGDIRDMMVEYQGRNKCYGRDEKGKPLYYNDRITLSVCQDTFDFMEKDMKILSENIDMSDICYKGMYFTVNICQKK